VSVKVTVSLPPDQAERLFWAFHSGELEGLGITDSQFLPQGETMNQPPVFVTDERVNAFRDALLNTCVRAARTEVPDITLSNCMATPGFPALAYQLLQLPLLSKPVEPSMMVARSQLMREMETK
jgi:hypothetical protein